MHLPFWLATALLFPVLLYQGKQARRTAPRLPEAGALHPVNMAKAPRPERLPVYCRGVGR